MPLNPWVFKNNPLAIDLNAVVHTGKEYVAVGGPISSPSGIYTVRSLAGRTWSQQQNPVNQGGTTSLASGNGTLLAMQMNPGSNSTATVSTDGGKTWTGHLTGISYTNNEAKLSRTTDWFIVTGAGGTNGIQRSPNGKTGWVHIPVPLNPILIRANVQNKDGSVSVSIGNDTMAFGNGPNLYKSFDQGLNWAIVPSNVGGSNHMYDICHTGTQYVAVGQAGQIMRAPDPDNWTKQFAPVTTTILRSVSGNDKLLVAVGDDQGGGKGPLIIASEDGGESWFEFPMPGLNIGLKSVVVNGLDVVVVGQSNGIQATIGFSQNLPGGPVLGRKSLPQLTDRIRRRLLTERGSFVYNPALGSNLHLLTRAKNMEEVYALAETEVRGALRPEIQKGHILDISAIRIKEKTLHTVSLEIDITANNRERLTIPILIS